MKKIVKAVINIKYGLYAICAIFFVVLIAISIINPTCLLNNRFLKDFINHELLNILAVTTSIIMAFSGYLVTLLSSLEESIAGFKFARTRKALKRNIIFLGCYFIGALVLLIVEGGTNFSDIAKASIYSVLLTALLMNMILIIQTHLISFDIPTKNQIGEKTLDSISHPEKPKSTQ